MYVVVSVLGMVGFGNVLCPIVSSTIFLCVLGTRIEYISCISKTIDFIFTIASTMTAAIAVGLGKT